MNSLLSNLGPRYSRRNNTTPIILGFLLLIIAIAVATYFLTRDDDDDDKDKKDENTSENVPSIEDPTVTRTLLPDSSNSSESGTTETYEIGGGKTETYQIEYNNGISDIELSKNVKIGITWSNKSGFENVYKLDIEHFIDNVKKNTKSIDRYNNGAKSGTEISTNKDYFTNFKGGLTHEFQGLEPYEKVNGTVVVTGDGDKKSNSKAYSFVGTHTIKIIATYTDKDSDKTINLTDGTTTKTVEVKTEDLAATLELTAPDVRVFKPIQGSFNLGDAEIDNKLYYASTTRTVMDYSVEIDIHKSIDINNLGPRPFTLIRASTDNSNQFYFKFSETEYLGYDGNKKLSIDSADNKKIITLVSSSLDNTEGKRYFRLSFGDDLYALIDKDSNGAVNTMDGISIERVYNTLDWEISTDLGFGIRLGNTNFYLIEKTDTQYKFGYYKGEVSLPENYKSIDNIPIMTINKNTRSATISQGSEHDVAFSNDGLSGDGSYMFSIDNIKDDDTRYRIYRKEKTGDVSFAEWEQKGYFEGKDVQ